MAGVEGGAGDPNAAKYVAGEKPVDTDPRSVLLEQAQKDLGAEGDLREQAFLAAVNRGEVQMPDATGMISQKLNGLKGDKAQIEKILEGIAADKLKEKPRTTDSEDAREVAFAAALASGEVKMPDLEGTYRKELDNINSQIAKGEAELAQEQQKNREREKLRLADQARIAKIQEDIKRT